MEAKEMFEKLGYKREVRNNEIIYEFLQESEDIYQRGYIDYMITFNTETKKLRIMSINIDEGDDFVVGIDELKAINKQTEELGWN